MQFAVLSLWQSPAELFVLLKNDAAGSQAELEFAGDSHTLRVTPVHWNDRTLRVNAPGRTPSEKVHA